jgi:hypothetical protein
MGARQVGSSWVPSQQAPSATYLSCCALLCCAGPAAELRDPVWGLACQSLFLHYSAAITAECVWYAGVEGGGQLVPVPWSAGSRAATTEKRRQASGAPPVCHVPASSWQGSTDPAGSTFESCGCEIAKRPCQFAAQSSGCARANLWGTGMHRERPCVSSRSHPRSSPSTAGTPPQHGRGDCPALMRHADVSSGGVSQWLASPR